MLDLPHWGFQHHQNCEEGGEVVLSLGLCVVVLCVEGAEAGGVVLSLTLYVEVLCVEGACGLPWVPLVEG